MSLESFVATGPKPVACHRAVHGSRFILIGYQATLYQNFYSSNKPALSVLSIFLRAPWDVIRSKRDHWWLFRIWFVANCLRTTWNIFLKLWLMFEKFFNCAKRPFLSTFSSRITILSLVCSFFCWNLWALDRKFTFRNILLILHSFSLTKYRISLLTFSYSPCRTDSKNSSKTRNSPSRTFSIVNDSALSNCFEKYDMKDIQIVNNFWNLWNMIWSTFNLHLSSPLFN